jgi:hypothetical protein
MHATDELLMRKKKRYAGLTRSASDAPLVFKKKKKDKNREELTLIFLFFFLYIIVLMMRLLSHIFGLSFFLFLRVQQCV